MVAAHCCQGPEFCLSYLSEHLFFLSLFFKASGKNDGGDGGDENKETNRQTRLAMLQEFAGFCQLGSYSR